MTTTQKFFEGKFGATDQAKTQQMQPGRAPFVSPMDDFYLGEGYARFRSARAHVVSCALGGFGVLRFGKMGEVTRLGYDHERPCKGEYTRDQAEALARG